MSSLFSSFKGTAQSLTAIRRPWRDFFDITAVDIPTSSSDATTRIAQNLTHFRLNYTIILLVILCFSLIYHPLALVTFFVILLAWFFLYLARDRDEPVVIFGFLIDDRLVLAALVGLTLAGLLLTGVWGNVLAAVAVGVGFVILHAVLRSTDDLVMDDLESPYGHVLAGGDDELDSPRGDYTVKGCRLVVACTIFLVPGLCVTWFAFVHWIMSVLLLGTVVFYCGLLKGNLEGLSEMIGDWFGKLLQESSWMQVQVQQHELAVTKI
ncbi:hypothetical protein V6N11_046467 [Hibiscus sabdariffa]|uniref:PRA1 family protein n=1 Tax=Hibiscus sabdariffa TaxID=183260 RepID=A0ABR2P2S1_9ROSI